MIKWESRLSCSIQFRINLSSSIKRKNSGIKNKILCDTKVVSLYCDISMHDAGPVHVSVDGQVVDLILPEDSH